MFCRMYLSLWITSLTRIQRGEFEFKEHIIVTRFVRTIEVVQYLYGELTDSDGCEIVLMEQLLIFIVIEGSRGGIQGDSLDDMVPMRVPLARDIWDLVDHDIDIVYRTVREYVGDNRIGESLCILGEPDYFSQVVHRSEL